MSLISQSSLKYSRAHKTGKTISRRSDLVVRRRKKRISYLVKRISSFVEEKNVFRIS